jgi:hypothetical protein
MRLLSGRCGRSHETQWYCKAPTMVHPFNVGAVSCLPSEVLPKLGVEVEVASDLCVSNQRIWISVKLLKCNPDIPHLQLDGVHQQCVAILSVDVHCFLDVFRNLYHIFMSACSIL